jgi:hypothetical protein
MTIGGRSGIVEEQHHSAGITPAALRIAVIASITVDRHGACDRFSMRRHWISRQATVLNPVYKAGEQFLLTR